MDNQTKLSIYKMIDEVDDASILNAVKENVIFYTSGKDILDELSTQQLNELYEALNEADKNDVISFSDFKKEINEWKSK